MDYTFKAPSSSSTRLPPPHMSPQMTQGEESHCLCQLGQGGAEESSTGDRTFCAGSTEGLGHTRRPAWQAASLHSTAQI